MRGNPHVRFGPEGAGKGPAPADTSPASYRGSVGPRVGWRVLEDQRLRAVAGVDLAQRAHLGTAPMRPARHRLNRAGQRVPQLRGPRGAAADL